MGLFWRKKNLGIKEETRLLKEREKNLNSKLEFMEAKRKEKENLVKLRASIREKERKVKGPTVFQTVAKGYQKISGKIERNKVESARKRMGNVSNNMASFFDMGGSDSRAKSSDRRPPKKRSQKSSSRSLSGNYLDNIRF